ncbi:hypothetical protein THASP1DRAFT_29381 [Thamnocephalis sphaerospora]|uniref:Iron-binding zinc finger CDGSH type domain-containing protein n=1 Tax=Thamnocephalis sphaerospora TaxID=78915 RepID=A0A4V1IWV0_9FUNG|nr:hypothetical protein THASP1DRAFT_29381 [Thamnocephalis sphaerospora]|eukprot:RKP08829.1 hypothetical protein THASP1DRAFT_29381 [Thamnocephalis sphaerospora]
MHTCALAERSTDVDVAAIEDLPLRPCVPMYHPSTVTGLRPGKTYLWCSCGLSRTQPWCDGKSHENTRFTPMEWTVPNHVSWRLERSLLAISHTAKRFCDGVHYDLPLKYLAQIRNCKATHDPLTMPMCDRCGWRPSPDERPDAAPLTDTDESELDDESSPKSDDAAAVAVAEKEENSEDEEGDEIVLLHADGSIEIEPYAG